MYGVRKKNLTIFNTQLFLIYRVQQKNLTIFIFVIFYMQYPAEKYDDF